MPDIPHFDLPFRFVGDPPRVASIEQDSINDVAVCVEATLRVRPGELLADPKFGTTDPTFSNPNDSTLDTLMTEVEVWEPRATVAVEDGWDFRQALRSVGITVTMEDNVG
jgi:hypothetical protein